MIKVPTLVQTIVTIWSTGLSSTHYQSKMATKNPRWPPRNQFFYISTTDGGDFPRIIEIALFLILTHFKRALFYGIVSSLDIFCVLMKMFDFLDFWRIKGLFKG